MKPNQISTGSLVSVRQKNPALGAAQIVLLLVLLLLSSGCGRKAQITGQVKDGFGKPLAGVSVSLQGTTFQATTGSDGNYAVPYVPGNVAVNYQKLGYTSALLTFNIATEAAYPAEAVTLYLLPQGVGVYYYGENDYRELARGAISLEKREEQPRFDNEQLFYNAPIKELIYMVRGDFLHLPAGKTLRFIDTDTSHRKRLFRLSGGNEILRRSQTAIGTVSYKAELRPEVIRSLSPELPVKEVTLPTGRYAFVTTSYDPQRSRETGGWFFAEPTQGLVENPVYLFEVGESDEAVPTPGPSRAASNSQPTTSQPTAGTNAVSTESFSNKRFSGTINGKYKIEMTLTRQGSELQGQYFYEKYRQQITLRGTIDGQSNFTLNEYDQRNNLTGTFKGRFEPNGKPAQLSGTWTSDRGSKSMSFQVSALN